MSLRKKNFADGRFVSAAQEEVISRFIEVHGGRYDYSKVAYVNALSKIAIICEQHGQFEQTPNHHLKGVGCPICGKLKAAKTRDYAALAKTLSMKRRRSVESFIEAAQAVHGCYYDYSRVDYVNGHTKVMILCEKHGGFEQTPAKHIHSKRGCGKCGNQTSKVADRWLDELGVGIREYRLPERKLRVVDGFDPATNTVYQFHGDFFHGNPAIYDPDALNPKTKRTFGEAYKLTQELDREIEILGYNLVVMWEADYVRQVGKKAAYEGRK